MKWIGRKWRCVTCAIAFAAAAATLTGTAGAGYILTPVASPGGSGSVTVAPGQSFTIDLVLSGDPGLANNSAIFLVHVTAPGLVLESFAWASPYETGSIFDASKPPITSLPLVIDDAILSGPAYPPGFIGFELANVVPIPGPGGVFTTGVIVTLELHVPVDWLKKMGPASVFISVIPDTFALGFEIIPTTAGPAFELIIIPAPGMGAMALAAFALLGARTRRRTMNVEFTNSRAPEGRDSARPCVYGCINRGLPPHG